LAQAFCCVCASALPCLWCPAVLALLPAGFLSMALRGGSLGAKRSASQNTKDNLRGTQAAQRQHLQQQAAAARANVSQALPGQKSRPPQLPNVPGSVPSTPPSRGRATPGRGDLQDASAASPTARMSVTERDPSPRSTSSRVHACIKESRSLSLEAFSGGSPKDPVRPISSSSSRATPRGSSRGAPVSNLADGMEDDEDDFADELAELEVLCQHLGMRGERAEEHYSLTDAETRPLTGGTSASASTTVPGGSIGGEAPSIDLDDQPSGVEALAESDNPFDTLQGAQRASYEMQNCALPHGCRAERTPGSSGQLFFTVDATSGPYTPATLMFWIKIFDEFPAPGGLSVRCTKRIFHPNIEIETGNLRLPQNSHEQPGARERHLRDLFTTIREQVLTPSDSPAANADAAMLLQTDRDEFRRVVRSTLAGGEYRGVQFDRVLDFSKKRAGEKEQKKDEQRPSTMSDHFKVEMMKLEVMRDQFKAQANDMIALNNRECRALQLEAM